MRSRYLITAGFILVLVAMGSFVYAGEEHRCCMMKGLFGLPDLTEEQQVQIEKLELELHEKMLPMKSQLEVKSAELNSLLIAENPDKSAIDKKIDEIGSLKTQIKKLHIKNRLNVRDLLTPEQRIGFDMQLLGMRKRFHKKMGTCKGEKMKKLKIFKEKHFPMEIEEEVEVEME